MTGPSRNSDSPLDPQSSHWFRLGESNNNGLGETKLKTVFLGARS